MLPSLAHLSMPWMLLSCLMLLSQVQGEDSQKESPSPRITCPSGAKAYGSHCYALYKSTKSWSSAELACQKRSSGHLVSVLTGGEAAFVSSLIKSTVNNYKYVWIGLHDPTEGQESNGEGWKWSSDDVLNYKNWDENPDPTCARGYCGTVSKTSDFMEWINYDCNKELPYVCKFKN